MNRKLKKFLKFFIITIIGIPILYFLYLFIVFSILHYQEIKDAKKGAGNIEWQIMKQKLDARLDAEWDHIHAGRDYEKTGQYELAIQEYKKAIEIRGYSIGVARQSLVDAYEKTGQYELAIEELNWLISRKPPDPKVMDEYIARKRKLEALLK